MDLPAGTVLAGRYRIVRRIGQGGMGVVYEAEHTALSRRVALKVLFDDDEKAVKRFQQEGRAMAKLTHPHIVAVVDYIAEAGAPPMLVMELLQGEPLARVLRREGKLEAERAVRIAIQILRGLAAAHDAGVIHRDVKPSNVFLEHDDLGEESVKLLDFGVAKLFDGDAVNTTLGGVVGTPSYLAPEQLRLEKGKKLDGRVDVHAVGIILYEMLSGRRPWNARHPTEISLEIASKPRTPLREHRPDLPAALGDVVDRALAIDREERHRDADAMLRAITRVSFGPSIKDTIVDPPPAALMKPADSPMRRTLPMEGRPKRPSDQSRGPMALALIAGVVLGGIATGTTFMLAQSSKAPAAAQADSPPAPSPTCPPSVTCPSLTCLPPLDPAPCPSSASSATPASASATSSSKPRARPPGPRDPGKTIEPPKNVGDLF